MGNSQNTNGKSWGGSRPGSGRKRKATCSRNGRTYVALDKIDRVVINGRVMLDAIPEVNAWWICGKRYTDFAAAAAEFVRRVNG